MNPLLSAAHEILTWLSLHDYGVLLVQASNGVSLDLALGTSEFEIDSVGRATPWEVETGLSIPTCSAEDLIVHKLVAGRPRDTADMEGVVTRQAGRLDVERIRDWVAVLGELKEDPDIGRPFERALASPTGGTAGRKQGL